MLLHYDHALQCSCREAFQQGLPFLEDHVRPEIFVSWKRSRQLGVIADMLPVALPFSAQDIMRPFTDGTRRKLFLGQEFDEFLMYLDSIGAVYFLMQEDLTVFFSGGDIALQKKLLELNIGTRSNFSEQYMGTTAISLAKITHSKENWCIGAEHYLDCFQDYATYAYWAHEDFTQYAFGIIVPKELFTDSFLAMIRYFHKSRCLSAILSRTSAELARQTELFNQLKDIQEEALLLVDFSQKITGTNRQFEEWFELSQEDVLHHDLTEILPELENMMICLRTGKSISLSETHFEGLPQKRKVMYVSCRPWKRNGIVNGMVLSFSSGKRIAGDATRQPVIPKDSYTFDDLIGNSPVFREVKKMARGVASSNSSIILTGESGTGKELFARAIHNESVRQHKPFVAVNCSAIPKELIGSELFGYGDGAFTGARKGGAMGKFEYAHGGTLFLDEVAELPLDVQAILLRVLEERAVVRIGTNTVIPVDVRIIAATNKNLLQMVKESTFRLDLYYRLNVITLELPPLRVRTGDIPLLVESFLESLSHTLDKDVRAVSPEAMDCLMQHEWPGNIRQLRNVVERGVNMATTGVLQLEDLPLEITASQYIPRQVEPEKIEATPPAPEATSYEDWERNKIWELMQKYRANKSRIAEEMGMSRGTLYKKIRRYGL